MPAGNNEAYWAKNITASENLIKTQGNTGQSANGFLGGIFCSANTSATVTIYDGDDASNGTKLIDTFTPVAGQSYPFPVQLKKGLFVALAGTISITVFWSQ